MPPADRDALLPAGLRDVLPPDADHAADIEDALRRCFRANGYERIKPPLIEFEASLLTGAGAAMERETFRLMDPESHRMMGLRADITVQIARIATSRLANAPRPLRVSYAGDVTRVTGTDQRPERQFTQVGAELIGVESAAADVEALLLAVAALREIGINDLCVDLSLPTLVPAIMDAMRLDADTRSHLILALDRKDAEQTAAVAGDHAELYTKLLDICGPAQEGIKALAEIDLPPAARQEAERLSEVVRLINERTPETTLTIDPVENRGLEYHTGVSFMILKPALRGELAAGGRYVAEPVGGGDGEHATGFTIYLDTVLRALGEPTPDPRVLLPAGTDRADATKLRTDGWITVPSLEPSGMDTDASMAEAARLGCSHVLIGGSPRPVADERGR
jgi:ATP phosphoribosyltransferase regulatory subunit